MSDLLYVCDRKKCENCSIECHLTRDVAHACAVSRAELEALVATNEKLTDENQELKKTIEEIQEANASFADDENTIEKLKRENEIQGMRLNYYETHREETEKRRNIIEGTYLNVIREIVLAIEERCRE